MHSIGIAGLILRPKSGLISAGAIWHAYVHFMPLSDSKGRRRNCGLEGGFLGGIGVLNIAVVQDAPLVSLRQNLVLSQSHRRFLPQFATAKSMRVCFVPFLEINPGVVVALFFFRITLPRLIRLFMGALIRLLPRVVFGGLFAHWDTSTVQLD
jgi:hypothetical protein